MTAADALLLYDGTCGFCARSVRFVLRHDRRRRTLRFATLQGAHGESARRLHPELAGTDSVIWYQPGAVAGDERYYVRSDATLRVLDYLGGGWSILAALGRIIPRAIRDAIYDLVARHRHRLVRDGESCVLPSPEERARFVD
jgi:predicted DCC family thiol-disulfide oxidoreductase YuxK